MTSFGQTLREAREAKNLTIRQIAEKTHMLSSIVEGLEKEDFSKIVAPIYGRGFVKLYCEVVGLDPKPLVVEFMDIYEGRRMPEIRERPQPKPVQPSAAEPPVINPIKSAEPPPAPVVPAPPPEVKPITPVAPEPPLPNLGPLFAPTTAEPDKAQMTTTSAPAATRPLTPQTGPTISRYASPIKDEPDHQSSFHLPKITLPPSFWRVLLLVVIAIALLCGIGYGLKVLYRATTAPQARAPEKSSAQPIAAKTTGKASAPAQGAKQQGTKPAAKAPPAARRTAQKIPSLYLD